MEQTLDSKVKLSGIFLLIMPIAIGIILYLVHLKTDLYGDENATLRVVSEGHILENLASPTLCHPPLYFILAKMCLVWTDNPWAIRIPSVLAAVGTVLLIGQTARLVYGRRVALWAVWLAALSPILIEFAAEGRPYAMLAFFSTALMYALLRFIESENRKTTILLSASIIGGLLTHYIFTVHVAFAGCYYLVKCRRLTKCAIYAALAIAPAIVLLVFGILSNAGQSSNMAAGMNADPDTILNLLARLPVAMSFGFCTFKLPNMDITRNVTAVMVKDNSLLITVMLIAFLGLGWLILRQLLRRQPRTVLLLCGIFVPVTLALMGIIMGTFMAKEKYLIGTIGWYIVLAASAFETFRKSWIAGGTVFLYLALVAVSILHYAVYPNEYSRRADWTGLRRFLHAHVNKGDAVLLYRVNRDSAVDVRPSVKGVRIVDIREYKPEQLGIGEFIEEIEESCQGHVYLVNREVDRHWLDPQRKAIHALKKRRAFEEWRFGRPLSLYIFHQRREDVPPITNKQDADTDPQRRLIRLPGRAGQSAHRYGRKMLYVLA
jgi:hypothetical protein